MGCGASTFPSDNDVAAKYENIVDMIDLSKLPTDYEIDIKIMQKIITENKRMAKVRKRAQIRLYNKLHPKKKPRQKRSSKRASSTSSRSSSKSKSSRGRRDLLMDRDDDICQRDDKYKFGRLRGHLSPREDVIEKGSQFAFLFAQYPNPYSTKTYSELRHARYQNLKKEYDKQQLRNKRLSLPESCKLVPNKRYSLNDLNHKEMEISLNDKKVSLIGPKRSSVTNTRYDKIVGPSLKNKRASATAGMLDKCYAIPIIKPNLLRPIEKPAVKRSISMTHTLGVEPFIRVKSMGDI